MDFRLFSSGGRNAAIALGGLLLAASGFAQRTPFHARPGLHCCSITPGRQCLASALPNGQRFRSGTLAQRKPRCAPWWLGFARSRKRVCIHFSKRRLQLPPRYTLA